MLRFLLLYSLYCAQSGLPKSFHAYAVASNGKNMIVDPDIANYVTCNEDIRIADTQAILGGEKYSIYNRQQTSDSMVTFFCRKNMNRVGDCSITVIPMKEVRHWYVLAAWFDSTKAYKTIISSP